MGNEKSLRQMVELYMKSYRDLGYSGTSRGGEVVVFIMYF